MANLKNTSLFIKAYKKHLNEIGKRPSSINSFTEYCKKKESDFYACFNSLEQLETACFTQLLLQDFETVKNSAEYLEYTSRERILAMFFSHFESLSANRSFVKSVFSLSKFSISYSLSTMKSYHSEFVDCANQILDDKNTEDGIPDRLFMSSKYKELIWGSFVFCFNFWLHDTSLKFEKTDACIEKSVNLTFDLLQENVVDHALDFGKFVFQNLIKR